MSVAAALEATARRAWTRDLTSLGLLARIRNRLVRIVAWTAHGLFRDRLSVHAGALAFYTVFSIVPVLAIALWALKSFGGLAYVLERLQSEQQGPLAANALLAQGVRQILVTVDRTQRLASGVVGLTLLAYVVVRMFWNVERAIDTIAGADRLRPRYARLLFDLLILAVPGVLLGFASKLVGPLRHMLGRPDARFFVIPVVLMGLWLTFFLLYIAAARACIGARSAAIGAVAGVALFALITWAFVRFQIGASHLSSLEFGLAAGPVALLWIFSSWYAVLVGAEIAVGHRMDRMLARGAAVGAPSAVVVSAGAGERDRARPRQARRRSTETRTAIGRRSVAELCGAFWLVFGGCGSAVFAAAFPRLGIGYAGVALAFGLSLLSATAALGPISGAHFNPAVSIGLWAGGRFPARELPAYIAAQVAGALLAGAVLYTIAGGAPGFEARAGFACNGYGAHSPGHYGLLAAAIAEVVFSAGFLVVFMGVTDPTRGRAALAPVAIGLALTVIHLVAIPLTNASVNPARSTGVAVVAGGWAVRQLWLFWAAPIVGGMLGALGYRLLVAPRPVARAALEPELAVAHPRESSSIA